MFKWRKIGTILMAVAMLVSMLTVPAMAEETVVFSEDFENAAVDESDGILKAGWQLENGAMVWKNDAENTAGDNVSITAEADDVHSGSYALKMRTTSVVSRNVYTVKYNQTPGTLYKISAWVKMVNPNNVGDVCCTITTGYSQNAAANDFLTMGAFNPYAANINEQGYFLQGVYGEWSHFTRYFAATDNYFYIMLGANTRGDAKAYIVWDDIEISKVDNVVFENTDGSAVEEITGGTNFNGTLLMGNIGNSALSYTGMKVLYERKENGCLQLLDIETFAIDIPVSASSHNTGQYRADLTFDMTEYEAGKDYVAKVFVWDSTSGMHPVVYGAQD